MGVYRKLRFLVFLIPALYLVIHMFANFSIFYKLPGKNHANFIELYNKFERREMSERNYDEHPKAENNHVYIAVIKYVDKIEKNSSHMKTVPESIARLIQGGSAKEKANVTKPTRIISDQRTNFTTSQLKPLNNSTKNQSTQGNAANRRQKASILINPIDALEFKNRSNKFSKSLQNSATSRFSINNSSENAGNFTRPEANTRHRTVMQSNERLKTGEPRERSSSLKVNVYYYDETCTHTSYGLTWNPLFPRYPFKAELRENVNDAVSKDERRKITGLLVVQNTARYEFAVPANSETDFILIEDFREFESGRTLEKFLVRLNAKRMKGEANNRVLISNPVLLNSGQKYLYDIVSVTDGHTKLMLKWRKANTTNFAPIDSNLLSPLHSIASLIPVLPNIKYFNETKNETMFKQNPQHDFYKVNLLNANLILPECEFTRDFPREEYEFVGVVSTQTDALYPRDELLKFHDLETEFVAISKANEIANKYTRALKGNFILEKIVRLEENKPKTRYFVEVDVRDKAKFYRSSGWVVQNESGSLCKAKDYTWNEKEIVYLLTPVKNQVRWIMYLINALNKIFTESIDTRFHLIIVDYNSTDCDASEIMTLARFPYTFISEGGNFNKVRGLNIAVKSVQEKEALLFVLDLQVQFPDFLFDAVRKHTFKSRTCYIPILVRTYCNEHPFYTPLIYSRWETMGYGIISMWKSDWEKIGGMNEKKFGEKWGAEDWELIDRIVKNKIEVIHNRLPGFVHLYHSTIGTWDGTKLY